MTVFLAALIPKANHEVSPDAALVHRLLQKDVRAFEQLYDRHSRIVYGLLRRILQQAGTAEEVAQEVFLQLCATPVNMMSPADHSFPGFSLSREIAPWTPCA